MMEVGAQARRGRPPLTPPRRGSSSDAPETAEPAIIRAAGGLVWLKSVAAPLAGLRFCPTGGVGANTAQAYLSLANVACVGGSWVAPREAVAAGDWVGIERLAAAASRLKRL